MDAIFFTGFPGFLGSALLPHVLARAPNAEAVCLVQSKYAAMARDRAEELVRQHPGLAARVQIVEGDITQPALGLANVSALQARVVEIFHLAAIYDLSVPRDFAMRVNVGGTRHMLDFARGCARLHRFQYVSTCYVSGRHPGTFTEEMLEAGQSFNNFYEETKYLAEVEVQRARGAGVPTTIYRPAVVVGDSTTGATQKYDGPYFVIQWLLRQPRIAIMPVVGNTARVRFNAVPRDFIIDAITYLSGRAGSLGQVYQLADPSPNTVDGMLSLIGRATGRKVIRLPLPRAVAKSAIAHVPGVYALLRIPASAIDYFVLPTTFGTTNTQRDLAGSGITCPPFGAYVDHLVHFVRQHPEISASAMA